MQAQADVLLDADLVGSVLSNLPSLLELVSAAQVSPTFKSAVRETSAALQRVVERSRPNLRTLALALALKQADVKRVRPAPLGRLTGADAGKLYRDHGGAAGWQERLALVAKTVKEAEDKAIKAAAEEAAEREKTEAALAAPIAPFLREAVAAGHEASLADGSVVLVSALRKSPRDGDTVEVCDQRFRQRVWLPAARVGAEPPAKKARSELAGESEPCWLPALVIDAADQLGFKAALQVPPPLVAEAAAAEAALEAVRARWEARKQEISAAHLAQRTVPTSKVEARKLALAQKKQLEEATAAADEEEAKAKRVAEKAAALAAPYPPREYRCMNGSNAERQESWRLPTARPYATNGEAHACVHMVDLNLLQPASEYFVRRYQSLYSFTGEMAVAPQDLFEIEPLSEGVPCIPITCVVKRAFDAAASQGVVDAAAAALAGWSGGVGESTWTFTPGAATWAAVLKAAEAAIVGGFRPRAAEMHTLHLALKLKKPSTPARALRAYREACTKAAARSGKSKGAVFKLEIAHIWECYGWYRGGGGGGCIDGGALVALAGGEYKPVHALAVGDVVARPNAGTAVVAATWRMPVARSIPMIELGGVHLTPDHPILTARGWSRPVDLAEPRLTYVHELFNFVLSVPTSLSLKPAGRTEASPLQACTLGQPVPRFPDSFYGTRKVIEYLASRPDWPNVVTEV